MGKASRIVWLETAWQDVRYGFRQLRRARALVAVAVLSLAIGIGANTAVFTLINAFMLQFLPVQEPGRLVLFMTGSLLESTAAMTPPQTNSPILLTST